MAFIHSHSRPVYDFASYRSESGICRRSAALLILILLTVLTSGCNSFYDALRAEPAPQTSFLPAQPKLSEMPPTFPFRKMWINPAVDMNRYRKIMISKVSTEHVLAKIPWNRVNESELFNTRAKECLYFAGYIENSFRAAVSADPEKRFQLSQKPDAQTLVLELSLVQVVPSKSFLNVFETVVGFIVPGFSLLTMFNAGEIAIEGKLKDAETGTLICMFADREKDRPTIINVAGLKWYRHSQININEWSREFVLILSSKNRLSVKRRFPITFFEK